MRAERSNRKISPHGGAVPVLEQIKRFGIPQVIRKCLGRRKKQARYGYEDVFIAWILTAMCGGSRIDHTTKLKKKLSIIPGLKLPSHDTLGRVMKSLATEKKTYRNITRDAAAKETFLEIDDNIPLNRMLISAIKRMGLLKSGVKYTLDIDATFIETKCHDSKMSFEKLCGFYPMICLIGDLPIFISMRNGNVAPKTRILDCLNQCLDVLNEFDIRIGTVVSDAAGYNKDVMEMLTAKGINFLIRPTFHTKSLGMRDAVRNHKDWVRTEIETSTVFWDCEVGDIRYRMYESPYEYRLIAVRIPNSETKKKFETDADRHRQNIVKERLGQLKSKNLLKDRKEFSGKRKGKGFEGYNYKFYITNDFKRTPLEIVQEMNARGDAERKFDFMKNDWAWRLPPFIRMSHNTVWLIATSLANAVFKATLRTFKKSIPELRLNSRLPDFQYVFMDVACELINGIYIFYNTDIAYEKII